LIPFLDQAIRRATSGLSSEPPATTSRTPASIAAKMSFQPPLVTIPSTNGGNLSFRTKAAARASDFGSLTRR
jgi:hypothetical protein